MTSVTELYNDVSGELFRMNKEIEACEKEIHEIENGTQGHSEERIKTLKTQLEKIDDYLLRVRGFQELAKKNLTSLNVLTVETPPDYRVNMNRLRNWSMMIDPMTKDDPYAQRVYVVTKCDEQFLEKKKKEFQDRITKLESGDSATKNARIAELRKQVSDLEKEVGRFVQTEKMATFIQSAIVSNSMFWYRESPEEYSNQAKGRESLAFGAYLLPLPIAKEQRGWTKTVMGDFYDENSSRVLVPAEYSIAEESFVLITCVPSRRNHLDRALQNYVLSIINGSPAGTRKVVVLDGVRYNSSSIGSLRQLEDSFALDKIPRNPEQLSEMLETIVSSFADIDEVIDLHDSVAEYNTSVEKEKQLPLMTIILFGWPSAYEGHDRELLHRIMTNHERYGISIVVVSYNYGDRDNQNREKELPEYALHNAIRINILPQDTTIQFPDKKTQKFVLYTFSQMLSENFVRSLKEKTPEHSVRGSEYTNRYSLEIIPPYERGYKKIVLPFGIDGKDEDYSLSFENENFATYLVGASRSGKSTLLHTLIAGLIRNYHPDNVELWLADFKQLEFKRYMTHLAPHIKYVLLDESTELVYDLIDKLTNEMLERQKLFARLGVQRIDQVNTAELDNPLPVIFVILDEFSIMSQSIADSPIYKLRLQNILAKGAALGIKFLFSSQTFTTGVAGLTATARAQIQQRIAMKGSKEEISETLELSSNLKTDQVRNWMDALPPHYALVKNRISADALPEVKRYLVMYIQNYDLRDQMIDQINNKMKAIEGYEP